MFPGLRLIQLLALGAPFWILEWIFPWGWVVPAVYLALLLVFCGQDLSNLPGADEIGIRRILPASFALGETHDIELRVTNQSARKIRVVIRDEWPEALRPKTGVSPVTVPPRGTATARYQVQAIERGMHEFGNIIVRVQHGLGLIGRELSLPVSQRIKIYPRFRGVDSYDLLARIDQRDEIVRKPRRVPGQATDFESLRPYVPGEDLRNIDWKATARRHALISRNRQVEKGQQVALLLDAGRFMSETLDGLSKLDHAMNAAIMVSYVAQKRGDAIALAVFSNRIESFLPPVRGPVILSKVLESLYAVKAKPVESDYWQVIAEVMGMLRRRSLVIMLTDLLDASASAGLLNNLKRAAGKHLVLCVILTEPRIREVAHGIPASIPEAYQKAAAADLLRRRRLALEHLRSRGVLVLETDPAHLSIHLVRRYLEIRKADLQ